MSLDETTWEQLDQELERWRRARRQATLWWRDDDAGAFSPELARLCALAASYSIPLCIAVIPFRLRPGLEAAMERGNCALQHGWAHANHAPIGEKAAELGEHRPLAQVLSELAKGRERLRDALGADFLPALVPPWNRIGDRVRDALHRVGLAGLSTFMPREGPLTGNGLARTNCHVDPIGWRSGARCRPVGEVLARLCEHLRQRRQGEVDADEPTGLLTHHLQHDESVWALLPQLCERLSAHPLTVRWMSGTELFPRG